MPRAVPTFAHRVRRDQRGFTLVEMLVVMAAGIIAASALFTILDVTLRQTTRTLSRIDATQRARNVLERIENELHSACVANKVQPILAGSSATSVSFWSQYGNGVNLTPVNRRITFDSAAGKLIETTYSATGSAPNWTPGGLVRTETLLTNVAQVPGTDVFQYFELREPANTTKLSVPLSPGATGNAKNASEVRITLVVKPTGGSNQNVNLAANTVTNSALLRLTPIANPDGVAGPFPPCE